MTKNLAASVRQRLLNLSQQRTENFQLILSQYARERFLYRLGLSPYSEKFVLKGAMLFSVWSKQPYRPTRDLDLLGFGENTLEQLKSIFKEICLFPVEEDGIRFLVNTIQCGKIREDQIYGGTRITLDAELASAKIKMQIDIGFGDRITPKAEQIQFPVLLDFPPPTLKCYPKETVVAEKYQAMIILGISNSRMKDFFDIWILCREFSFQGRILSEAIQRTFETRKSPLPEKEPFAFTAEFYNDSSKQQQWNAFLRKGNLEKIDLQKVIIPLKKFLLPPTQAILKNESFEQTWNFSEYWQKISE